MANAHETTLDARNAVGVAKITLLLQILANIVVVPLPIRTERLPAKYLRSASGIPKRSVRLMFSEPLPSCVRLARWPVRSVSILKIDRA